MLNSDSLFREGLLWLQEGNLYFLTIENRNLNDILFGERDISMLGAPVKRTPEFNIFGNCIYFDKVKLINGYNPKIFWVYVFCRLQRKKITHLEKRK